MLLTDNERIFSRIHLTFTQKFKTATALAAFLNFIALHGAKKLYSESTFQAPGNSCE